MPIERGVADQGVALWLRRDVYGFDTVECSEYDVILLPSYVTNYQHYVPAGVGSELSSS